MAQLTAEGQMAPAGLAAVQAAKQNGTWSSLDDVESMVVPNDLIAAIDAQPGAREYFDSLSRMKLWEILYWIAGAKRETTRADRIRQIAEAAAQGKRPDRFRQ